MNMHFEHLIVISLLVVSILVTIFYKESEKVYVFLDENDKKSIILLNNILKNSKSDVVIVTTNNDNEKRRSLLKEFNNIRPIHKILNVEKFGDMKEIIYDTCFKNGRCANQPSDKFYAIVNKLNVFGYPFNFENSPDYPNGNNLLQRWAPNKEGINDSQNNLRKLVNNSIERFSDDNLHPLTVYKVEYNKIRLGSTFDGGYIIYIIPNINYDLLLSGGICDDTTFEDSFLELHPAIKCYAFDGTITENPSKHPNFIFIKKNIGTHNNDTISNLNEYLNNYKTIFLKMDIEGGEREWLSSLSDNQMDNIVQFVMEFHYSDTFGGIMNQTDLDLFHKINKTHVLVHIHGNNNNKVFKLNDVTIPEVFECTYINKKYIKNKTLNTDSLPSNLDTPNRRNDPDINLNFPPYVN